jgi:Xaa-Pro aminopeptidase
LLDLSFDTISGTGPHGAIVHYRVTEKTNRRIKAGDLYLIDSGGQYQQGTTDVTRTVLVEGGKPPAGAIDAFTRVLRGHIALAMAHFPAGTNGMQLDTLARAPLWEVGLDFDHGTGHGVGSYLSVHEGPQRISKGGTVALQEGMIVSNEPGYYKANAFGIRIENLQYVTVLKKTDGPRPMMGFEPLTLAPIDRRLIDKSQMSAADVNWLNAYHARVQKALLPKVDKATQSWLKKNCKPL